jgi:hypothetical protein
LCFVRLSGCEFAMLDNNEVGTLHFIEKRARAWQSQITVLFEMSRCRIFCADRLLKFAHSTALRSTAQSPPDAPTLLSIVDMTTSDR